VGDVPAWSPSPLPPSQARGSDRRRALGRLGEQLAAIHLERLRFTVLARNVRTRRGEIDLIAFDGRTLVFAEVKTRRVGARRAFGPDQYPLAGLRLRQRARLRGLAVAWLRERQASRPRARIIRFDAIGVLVDGSGELLQLDHVEGAW